MNFPLFFQKTLSKFVYEKRLFLKFFVYEIRNLNFLNKNFNNYFKMNFLKEINLKLILIIFA
jgi:hypothetical protein